MGQLKLDRLKKKSGGYINKGESNRFKKIIPNFLFFLLISSSRYLIKKK